MGVLGASGTSPVIRGATLSAVQNQYIEAARAIGAGHLRIWRHALGLGPILLLHRALDAVWPGAAISLAVFGFNMFGDPLRDVLDPRLRGTGGGLR